MTGGRNGPILILASTSPRRQELLKWLGLPFEVRGSQVEEHEPAGVAPRLVAEELAIQKARAVAANWPDALVLAADTVVALDGVSLGKPADEVSAIHMLEQLSGRKHDVITGVAVVDNGSARRGAVISRVSMHDVGRPELEAYAATSEPYDKAGGYALQGQGGALVEHVDGCVLTVVGFPLCLVRALLDGRGTPDENDVKICERAAEASYRLSIRGSHDPSTAVIRA